MSESYGLPTQLCPACGYLAECASNMTGDGAPVAGDISMCLSCGTFLRFDSMLRTEKMPAEEFGALDDDAKKVMFRMRLAWATMPNDERRKMRERGGRA